MTGPTGPGTLIADRYRLDDLLASGGMGAVWKGWDERLQRTVAIKVLPAPGGADAAEAAAAAERALREGRLTARLQHPHAVPVFDVVDHDGRPCLVMQYVPSTSLQAVLGERGALPPAQVARIGADVASALTSAHRAGVIHRDVKPGNVLIAEDGTVKLTDFGISHALGDPNLTSTGIVTGTPAYLAPEVARGGSSGFASDVFSLGATLYRAVEGHGPFDGDPNPMATLHRVASGEFAPPTPGAPLTPLLERMLSVDPADRPPVRNVALTLATLADELHADGRMRPAPGPRTGPTDPFVPVPSTRQAPPVRETPSTPPPRVAPLPTDDPPVREARPPARDGGGHDDRRPPTRDQPPVGRAPTLDPVPGRPRRGRRRAGIALAAAAVVAAVVLALVLLTDRAPTTGPSAGGTRTTPAASTSASASASSTPPTTAASSPPPSSSPATSTPATSAPPANGTPTAAQLTQAITSYYALLPGDTADGWNRLTPTYQNTPAGGRDGYDSFWGQMSAVDVGDVVATPPSGVEATVVYHFRDGRVTTERTSFTLVPADGILKINASTVVSSS